MFPKLLFIILLSFIQSKKSSFKKSSQTIILIRHGEKISDDYSDLSPEGQARADCLPELFTKDELGYTPSKIYANERTLSSTRPYDTVTPLAEYLGLEIEEFKKSNKNSAKNLLSLEDAKLTKSSKKVIKDFVENTLLKDEHDVILVCSSHQVIPIISNLLGKEVDASGDKGFDKYFIFQNGKLVEKGKQSDYISKCIKEKLNK